MTNSTRPARVYSSEGMLRQTAVDIARFACCLESERCLGHRKFDNMTVAREPTGGRLVSGELPQFVLKLLGVRDARLVSFHQTRDDRVPWRAGRNLPRIVFPKAGMFVWARYGRRPQPGDILYVTLPEYVCVLEELAEQAGIVAVFEYGRRDSERSEATAYRTVRSYREQNDSIYVGSSRLRGWLDLSSIPGLLMNQKRQSGGEEI